MKANDKVDSDSVEGPWRDTENLGHRAWRLRRLALSRSASARRNECLSSLLMVSGSLPSYRSCPEAFGGSAVMSVVLIAEYGCCMHVRGAANPLWLDTT